MFDSKSPAIKVVGYIIVGFFVTIIIISFGMPDFMSRLGLDKSTVGVVNGEKIHYLDFLRYRDSFTSRYKEMANSKEMQTYILDSMIRYRLQLQQARKMGVRVSEETAKRSIRESAMFRDQTGKFNTQYFNYFLDHYHMSLTDYYAIVQDELTNATLVQLIRMGTGVTPDEVRYRNAIDGSKIQVRYCFASNADLKAKMAGGISVSDAEVDEELKKNKSEIKDPKTDRARIRSKLESRKFEDMKKVLVRGIDDESIKGMSFDAAAAKLGGRITTSAVFKVGDQVREDGPQGKPVHSLGMAPAFINDCLALDPGKSSRVISSFDGLYVFTPVKKDIVLKDLPAAEYEAAESRLLSEKSNALYIAMMTSFLEKSKIQKNLDTK
jgi:hypothetical protein